MKRLILCSIGLFVAEIASAQSVTVSALNPARNSNAVARTTPVRVELSQLVSSGTVRVHSLQHGGQLAGTVASAGTTIAFTPAQAYQPGERLLVTVPAGARSTTGSVLTRPQVYQLTTQVTPSTGLFVRSSSVLVGPAGNPALPYADRIIAADIDGDGDQDMLVTNYTTGPGRVSVRLNDGTGTFAGGTDLAVGNYPGILLLADLDGDSDLDLLVGRSSAADVSVLLNAGNGTFGPAQYTRTNGIATLQLGDVDGDADLDLLVSRSNQTASVYLNNGTGSFSAGATVAGGTKMQAVGDLDNDGALDLVTDDPNAPAWGLLLRRGNGDGTFAATATAVALPIASSPLFGLDLLDSDADGDLDLLLTTRLGLYIMHNVSSASSLAFNPEQLLAGSGGLSVASVADAEGDGDLDILTTNSQNSVGCYRNSGAGVFTLGSTLASSPALTGLATADVDGDGDLDLLTIGSLDRRASVWLNLNTAPNQTVTGRQPSRNALRAAPGSAVAVQFSQPLSPAAMPMEGLSVARSQSRNAAPLTTAVANGYELRFTPANSFAPGEKVQVSLARVLAGGSSVLPAAQVYEFTAAAGVGPGTFVRAATPAAGGTINDRAVLPADFDGDGDLDLCLLSASLQDGSFQVLRNAGNGMFTAVRSYATGVYPTGLRVADMDGDGDQDIIVSSGSTYGFTSGLVQVFKNNGSGTFSLGSSLGVGIETMGLTTGDLDGDGDQDVIVLTGSTKALILLNDGDGTCWGMEMVYPAVSIVSLAPTLASLQLADVDNDDNLDLLVYNAQGVSISLNNGEGSFAPATLLTTPASGALALADVDADGDLDMLTGNGGQVNVLTNNGLGSFALRATLPITGSSSTISSLATGDIDGDGDQDLLASGINSSGQVSVRLNDGAGNFSGSYSFQAASSLSGALVSALGDFDQDGDLDLTVMHYIYGGIDVCLNQAGTLTATTAGTGVSPLALFPNPGRQSTLSGAGPGQLVRVLDAVGREVLVAKATAAGTCQLALPATLAGGVYVVRVGEQAVRLLAE
ncbi:MAG: hypothetical protein EOO36_01855 [Cytophagaceae bacterium]|nr:MAG: hypothetical protein EOO36_01855 [Cytophagaceae bacterium]